VKKLAPKTVELRSRACRRKAPPVGWMRGASFANPFRAGGGRAIEKGFARSRCFTREGGSIPVVVHFQEDLGLPSVLFVVGLPD